MDNTRNDLLTIFQAALNAVAGKTAVERELLNNNYKRFSYFVAIGKAAEAMLSGVPDKQIKSALLISKHDHISEESYSNTKITCIESDHPIPKIASIDAGSSLIEYLENLPKKEPILLLISGGTSSLVEVLQDGWDLNQLQVLTDYLLANAYSINDINAVRRQLSKIKGGGLWSYLDDRDVSCLMISDVPDDDPAIIGSGLLFASKEKSPPKLPKEWADKLIDNTPTKTPENFNWKIIACLEDAKNAAAVKAQSLGYQVKTYPDFLKGNASDEAKTCIKILQDNKNKLCIWGGETMVNLPENAGKGGRNQHLALSAAIAIQDQDNIHLLAAGTDGSDGMTTATGAIVDNLTVEQGKQKDLNATDYLLNADSNSYFKATDGLITTGATGTNVMDLVIGICHQKSSRRKKAR